MHNPLNSFTQNQICQWPILLSQWGSHIKDVCRSCWGRLFCVRVIPCGHVFCSPLVAQLIHPDYLHIGSNPVDFLLICMNKHKSGSGLYVWKRFNCQTHYRNMFDDSVNVFQIHLNTIMLPIIFFLAGYFISLNQWKMWYPCQLIHSTLFEMSLAYMKVPQHLCIWRSFKLNKSTLVWTQPYSLIALRDLFLLFPLCKSNIQRLDLERSFAQLHWHQSLKDGSVK